MKVGTLFLFIVREMGELLDQESLLDLLTRKDNRAYQHLYQCYYLALKALANYYVKNNGVAEDLVQDVFMSMLESDYSFGNVNEVKYFLYGALKNKCISHFRKQKVRNEYCQTLSFARKDEELFWDKVLEEDVYARLMTAVDTLPPQCKLVMMLTLEGLKVSEVAKRLSISEETVKDHKNNGKKKLATLLKDEELIYLIALLWL